MSTQPQPTPAAAVQPIDGPIETRVWPFPPASGPDTLRRCIAALVACEDRLREDMANLLAIEGSDNPSPDNMGEGLRHHYDQRAELAELARLTIAEAREAHQRLQADAIAMAALRGPEVPQ